MLIDGGASVARRLQIPESIINFTVVAFGTSLPKAFTVLLATYNGYADLVIGTIIGSCIFNLLGILSIIGLGRPIRSNKYTASIGMGTLFMSVVLLYILSNFNVNPIFPASIFVINKPKAIFLLIGFVSFMTYGYFNVKKHHTVWFDELAEKQAYYPIWFSVVLLVVGCVGLIAGGVLIIDNLIDISRKFDMSQRFLGQFVLSFGGSIVMLYWILITKADRTKFELSNLVGQSILNILGILGVAAFITPIQFNPKFNIDIFVLLSVVLAITAMLWMGKKLTLNLVKCKLLFGGLIVYIIYLFVY